MLVSVLVLVAGCAKDGNRPPAPLQELHYPAWLATTTAPGLEDKLLVVNLDQDLFYANGSMVALQASATDSVAGAQVDRGIQVPYMAGQLLVVDGSTAAGCTVGGDFEPPFALVAGRSQDALYKIPLEVTSEAPLSAQPVEVIGASFDAMSHPLSVALTCGADGTPRAWMGYQLGRDFQGYVARVDLSRSPPDVIRVNVGSAFPRSLAYDKSLDRLYVATREGGGHAYVHWLTVGDGCKAFDGGVQDERLGGCHVDPGFDVAASLAGAEPNEIALASSQPACADSSTGRCPRMFVSMRMYDADAERATNERPGWDIGGKLVVLDLPESSEGRPEPRWVRSFDIGQIAGPLLVIPRAGKRDLVVVTALDDNLVWIYDDDTGAMVKVFGRDPNNGVLALGHQPASLASRQLPGGIVRVFVSSYLDHFVSAIDVPLDDPAGAYVVHEGSNPRDATKPILRLGVKP